MKSASTHHEREVGSDFGKCNRLLLCVVEKYFVLNKHTGQTMYSTSADRKPEPIN